MKEMKILVWEEKFAIAKSKKKIADSFAVIQDKKEITSIFNQRRLSEVKKDLIKVEKGYRLITFDMVFDFGFVGFIAKISKALAEENIPILVISSYSTDHILVKQKYLTKALRAINNFELK